MVKLFSKVNVKQLVSSKVRSRSLFIVTSIVAGTCLATASSIFSPASAFASVGNVKDSPQLEGKSNTYTVNTVDNFGMNYSSTTATANSSPIKFQASDESSKLAGTGHRRKVPEPGTTGALGVVTLGAIALLKRNNSFSKEA